MFQLSTLTLQFDVGYWMGIIIGVTFGLLLGYFIWSTNHGK